MNEDNRDEVMSTKLARVCEYIASNIDDELSLEILSKVMGMSKFHFHRVFASQLGRSLYSYIQLIRFKRASYQLVFREEIKIIDIALDAKFESPEAFSRAFKRVFGVTPTQFRERPDWEEWSKHYDFKQPTGEFSMKVEVVELDNIRLAVLEHKGSPASLNNTVAKFIQWRKSSGESPITSSRTFGIVYNDPNNTPPDEFRFDACGEIKVDIADNEFGIVEKSIPQGKYAVVRHIGSHDLMDDKIYALYRDWLPSSGEELRDFPLFFQYISLLPEVAENEMITDIYLPLK